MENSLVVKCFFEVAREEGKKVIMSCGDCVNEGNTYEMVDLNKYKVNGNVLIVNGKKIDIRDVYESRDGYLMRVGELELVMS